MIAGGVATVRDVRIGFVVACLTVASIVSLGRGLVYRDGSLSAVDWQTRAAESSGSRITSSERNPRINDRYYDNGAVIPWVTYEAETMETNAVISDPLHS